MGVYRMSEEEAKALGYGHLVPPKVTRASNLNELGQNKLEARFAHYLETLLNMGAIKRYDFESIKFRLAKKTWYTPDFCVVRSDGRIGCYETKGFWRDDARVKIKVAAEKYPHIAFIAVRMVNREWEFDHIEGRGSDSIPK
jgi:hypothetical protein